MKDHRDNIIASIRDLMATAGTDWTKCWSTLGQHRNAITGRPYQGGNAFHLSAVMTVKGYGTPLWLTWRQLKAAGAHPHKDQWEKSYLVFWMASRTIQKTGDHGEPVVNEEGEPVTRTVWNTGAHQVWNVEQTTLAPEKFQKYLPEQRENAEDAEVEAWVHTVQAAGGCAPFDRSGSDVACYIPAFDSIKVPALGQFDTSESFYLTLFHEMAHSTGHKSRLARGLNNIKGSDAYAQEELVAELTAVMLGAEFGFDGNNSSAKYLNNWLSRCEDKSGRTFFTAATRAKKAVDFMTRAAERGETGSKAA